MITPQSVQKVSGGSRSSAAAGSNGRSGARSQLNGSGELKHGKVRGAMRLDENETRASKVGARDGQREKPPSKDGTVQRTAKEVEGLKDFVRTIDISSLHTDTYVGMKWEMARAGLHRRAVASAMSETSCCIQFLAFDHSILSCYLRTHGGAR